MDTALAALIAAFPATIAAVAAWRASKRTHQEVRTNHGMRAGEYLEMMALGQQVLKSSLDLHTAQDEENFERILAEQARVARELAKIG